MSFVQETDWKCGFNRGEVKSFKLKSNTTEGQDGVLGAKEDVPKVFLKVELSAKADAAYNEDAVPQ